MLESFRPDLTDQKRQNIGNTGTLQMTHKTVKPKGKTTKKSLCSIQMLNNKMRCQRSVVNNQSRVKCARVNISTFLMFTDVCKKALRKTKQEFNHEAEM